MPPSDPAREEQQLARLRALAIDADLDPEFAQKWFTFVVAEVIRHHTEAADELTSLTAPPRSVPIRARAPEREERRSGEHGGQEQSPTARVRRRPAPPSSPKTTPQASKRPTTQRPRTNSTPTPTSTIVSQSPPKRL